MKFILPNVKRNKPDLSWIWSQCMHMLELKDAIQQSWYTPRESLFDEPRRSKAKINEELNAIANLRSGVISLEKALANKIDSLQTEYDQT